MMLTKRYLLTIFSVFSVLIVFPAFAADRYASPTGSGTTCSEAVPCSVQEAVDQSQPGDHAILKDGTYTMSAAITSTRDGTLGNPITIRAENRRQAIINSSAGKVVQIRHSYHTIRGLVINQSENTDGSSAAIRTQRTGTIIPGTVIEDNQVTGWRVAIRLQDSDGAIARWNHIVDTGTPAFYLGYVDGSRVSNNGQIYANTITRPGLECFDPKPEANNNDIHHNICEDTGWLTDINGSNNPRSGASGNVFGGIAESVGNNNRFHNNIFRRVKAHSSSGGFTLFGASADPTRVDHNVFRDSVSPSKAIGANDPGRTGGTVEIDNNTWCNLSSYVAETGPGWNYHDNNGNFSAGLVAEAAGGSADCDAEETRILTEMQELPGNPTPGGGGGGTPPNCIESTQSTFVNSGIENQTGTFTWTFNATPTGMTGTGLVGLAPSTVSAATDMAAIARFNVPDNKIDVRNGGIYTSDATVTITSGLKYSFRFVVTISTKKYDVYVTPDGGGETQIAAGYDFRTEQAATTNLNKMAVRSDSVGSLLVCDSNISDPVTTTTFNQFSFRGTQILGRTGEASPVWLAAENTNFTVAPQSIFGLRTKVVVKVNDPGSEGFKLYCAKNGGAYAALTNVFTAGIRMLGSHPDVIADGTATTRLMTQEEATFVEGRIWLTDSPMTWDADLDSEGEHEWGVQLDNTVVPGDFYDCRVRKSDGTVLGTYTQTPRITVQDYQSGGGF